MLECKICGCKFNATVEKHYLARTEVKIGISAISGGSEATLYDAFDCPQCGCQNLAQERKRAVLKENGAKA